MTNRYAAHQALIEETKLLCSKEFPKHLRMHDRITGTFYAKRFDNGLIDYIPYKFNKNGMPDCYGTYFLEYKGIVFPLSLELEFKTGSARLNKDQVKYRDYCNRFGILWFEVRDSVQFVKDLKDRINLFITVLEGRNQ